MMMNEPRIFQPDMSALRGRWETSVSMAKHVSWRAGGNALRTYTPSDVNDLANMLKLLPSEETVLFIGLGSNLLVRDGGFKGTVVFLHAALNALNIDASNLASNEPTIYAEAGVASPKVARFAANLNCDAAFLAGIPGTIGGALAMNAGCYGAETWSFVEKVRTIDRQGIVHIRSPEEFDIGYRHVASKDAAINGEAWVGAWFRFPFLAKEVSREKIKSLLEKRVATQPLRFPNSGSVFRNPQGDFAARLIEATGLKGLRIGGAEVSEQHANFIVNKKGLATACDIERLITDVQERVARATGIRLIPEVRIVGDALPLPTSLES